MKELFPYDYKSGPEVFSASERQRGSMGSALGVRPTEIWD